MGKTRRRSGGKRRRGGELFSNVESMAQTDRRLAAEDGNPQAKQSGDNFLTGSVPSGMRVPSGPELEQRGIDAECQAKYNDMKGQTRHVTSSKGAEASALALLKKDTQCKNFTPKQDGGRRRRRHTKRHGKKSKKSKRRKSSKRRRRTRRY